MEPGAETLYAYANRRRREITEGVNGGSGRIVPVTIAAGTFPFPIDATTRNAIASAATATTLAGGDAYTVPSWLLPTGRFITLDATAIVVVALAISVAFQAVFSAQAAAFAGIADGSVTTHEAVDAILGS
ncbi:hypothetical protein [uncultured Methylobacterium sp.]|uniref:DUF4376 domain-containing protein n=1 Tax=uncultured Methylobacterium sp. TaxID=157278 RepID=UPI0035CC3476